MQTKKPTVNALSTINVNTQLVTISVANIEHTESACSLEYPPILLNIIPVAIMPVPGPIKPTVP